MKSTFTVGQRLSNLVSPLLLAGLVLGTPVYAEEVQDLDRQVEKLDKRAKAEGVAQSDLMAVSKATGVPLAELNRQQGKAKVGPGSLLIANSLAAKTGQSFEAIMALKASGKGWGQIAKDNNVKLGPLLKQAKQVGRVQAQDASAEKKAQRTASQPGSADRTSKDRVGTEKNSSTDEKKEAAGNKTSHRGGKGKQ